MTSGAARAGKGRRGDGECFFGIIFPERHVDDVGVDVDVDVDDVDIVVLSPNLFASPRSS